MQSNSQISFSRTAACIWDFDKTLISGYMQAPIFNHYKVDALAFWKEVNDLPEIYLKQGQKVEKSTFHLNHFLNYVQRGIFKGLNNAQLFEFGKSLKLCPGLPEAFEKLCALAQSKSAYIQHELVLEHYIVSTGFAEMIRGCALAPLVKGIYGCEFLDERYEHLDLQGDLFDYRAREIYQIGTLVDNTIKTRFIHEINKGSNYNDNIDVNANISEQDRRIPFASMIYIADGPSDVPAFSVINAKGGKTFAVYQSGNTEEFKQNDDLLQAGRINCYGPNDYREESTTFQWLKIHLLKIFDSMVELREKQLKSRVQKPPIHLHQVEPKSAEE